MQLLPDANIEFLTGLQQALIDEAQAPLRAQAEQMVAPQQAGNFGSPGGAPPMAPGAPPGLASLLGMGGPGGGSAPLPQAPAADELRRMMA
jgi:hypothetical protein